MSKRTYVAMIEPGSEGYGVSFPDLAGCVSYGDDYEAAIRGGEEALSLHLEGMAEDGVAYIDPSPLNDLANGPESLPPGGAWALITVEAPDSAERVNVYLPKSVLERIDRYTTVQGTNRSAFFTAAAREYMSSHPARG